MGRGVNYGKKGWSRILGMRRRAPWAGCSLKGRLPTGVACEKEMEWGKQKTGNMKRGSRGRGSRQSRRCTSAAARRSLALPSGLEIRGSVRRGVR